MGVVEHRDESVGCHRSKDYSMMAVPDLRQLVGCHRSEDYSMKAVPDLIQLVGWHLNTDYSMVDSVALWVKGLEGKVHGYLGLDSGPWKVL